LANKVVTCAPGERNQSNFNKSEQLLVQTPTNLSNHSKIVQLNASKQHDFEFNRDSPDGTTVSAVMARFQSTCQSDPIGTSYKKQEAFLQAETFVGRKKEEFRNLKDPN
jgi:hypothetical protein